MALIRSGGDGGPLEKASEPSHGLALLPAFMRALFFNAVNAITGGVFAAALAVYAIKYGTTPLAIETLAIVWFAIASFRAWENEAVQVLRFNAAPVLTVRNESTEQDGDDYHRLVVSNEPPGALAPSKPVVGQTARRCRVELRRVDSGGQFFGSLGPIRATDGLAGFETERDIPVGGEQRFDLCVTELRLTNKRTRICRPDSSDISLAGGKVTIHFRIVGENLRHPSDWSVVLVFDGGQVTMRLPQPIT